MINYFLVPAFTPAFGIPANAQTNKIDASTKTFEKKQRPCLIENYELKFKTEKKVQEVY